MRILTNVSIANVWCSIAMCTRFISFVRRKTGWVLYSTGKRRGFPADSSDALSVKGTNMPEVGVYRVEYRA